MKQIIAVRLILHILSLRNKVQDAFSACIGFFSRFAQLPVLHCKAGAKTRQTACANEQISVGTIIISKLKCNSKTSRFLHILNMYTVDDAVRNKQKF